MLSWPIHVVAHVRTSFFLWLKNTPLCGWSTSYPLSVCGHLGWFPPVAVVNYAAMKHSHTRFCMNVRFTFSWINIEEENCSVLHFLRNCQTVFPSGCTSLHPQLQCEGSSFSPSLPALTSFLFFYSHPSGCEMASHCGFESHFPDDWWCSTSLHVLFGYLYIFSENWAFLLSEIWISLFGGNFPSC